MFQRAKCNLMVRLRLANASVNFRQGLDQCSKTQSLAMAR